MPDAGPSASPSTLRSRLGLVACVFAATLVAYLPALRAGFVWNDSDYVTQASLRSWHGLFDIWFKLGSTLQYFPVLHSAFWIEHRLWGDAPFGYHLFNVLLHATGACLFARLLERLRVPGAWLAAFLFALHPVCVESVAWITEEKNTLSTVFYLLAALSYLTFDEDREWTPYVAGLVLFMFALLSKSVAATLPGALLVLVWLRRGRITWWQDVVPLLPWFAVGVTGGLFTAWVERTFVGAQGSAFDLSAVQRCLIAGRAVWFYANKLLWPTDLIFIYPRWTVSAASIPQYAFPLGVLALVIFLWKTRGASRAPLAAALIFIGSLFPTLGFFNVYAFLFSFVADHFAYLPSLSLIALASAGVLVGLGRLPLALRSVAWVGIAAVVALLGSLTWRQTKIYRDLPTLYQAILQRNPDCWMAHANLGIVLQDQGKLSEAIEHYEAALKIKPDYAEAHDFLGTAFSDSGRLPEAIEQYETALSFDAESAETLNNLGNALIKSGNPAAALDHLQKAAQIRPNDPDIRYNLGNALFQLGRAAEAVEPYRAAIRIRPDYAEAHNNLGNALTATDHLDEAIQEYQEAARLKPDYLEAHFNLAIVLLQLNRTPEAKSQFESVLEIKPDYRPAREALDRLNNPPAN